MSNDKSSTEDREEELRRKAAEHHTFPIQRESPTICRGRETESTNSRLKSTSLRTLDAEIEEEMSKLRRQDSPSSSSSSGAGAPIAEELGRQLFIRRELQTSDIKEDQNRLSMPCSQANEEVLTAAERARMDGGERIPAVLIDAAGRRYDVELKLTMAGKTSRSYAIGKPWNEIKRENKLRAGMVMKVWAFRGERGQLCLQLEREEEDEEEEERGLKKVLRP